MTRTFELNGHVYRTDDETADVLRSVVPGARESGDTSALQAVLGLGLSSGRVRPERVILSGAVHVVEACRTRSELGRDCARTAADWDARGVVALVSARRPRGRRTRLALVFSTGEAVAL